MKRNSEREQKVEYRPKLKKTLLWDYEISDRDLDREDVYIFYLSRILNNGTYSDIREIPVDVIQRHLPRLHLSGKVRKFWEWYLKDQTESQ